MPALLLLQTLLSWVIFPFARTVVRELRAWPRVPVAEPPDDPPRVAICVPARDEERSIERCVRSLLGQRYPRDRFRVIVLDDRSSDATPRILAGLAAEDDRLCVLQGSPLPAGWQGKCWALHQAAGCADADARYLLFVDADTAHDPRMLASAVRYARERDLEMLSLGTGQDLGSPAERLVLPTILAVIMAFDGTPSEVNDPSRPDVAKANGQFILFRADAYRALGGHEAVRGEIVEDFALARRAKRMGLRLMLADGRWLVRTRMYHSAGEIWEGFSKNAYDEAQRHTGGALGGLVGLPVLALGPYALAALGLRRVLRRASPMDLMLLVQGLLQASALLALGRVASLALGLPGRYGVGQPISAVFLWGILLNSTWRTLSGRGVVWKGRTYEGPSAAVR